MNATIRTPQTQAMLARLTILEMKERRSCFEGVFYIPPGLTPRKFWRVNYTYNRIAHNKGWL